jgi:hypothetical protein
MNRAARVGASNNWHFDAAYEDYAPVDANDQAT